MHLYAWIALVHTTVKWDGDAHPCCCDCSLFTLLYSAGCTIRLPGQPMRYRCCTSHFTEATILLYLPQNVSVDCNSTQALGLLMPGQWWVRELSRSKRKGR